MFTEGFLFWMSMRLFTCQSWHTLVLSALILWHRHVVSSCLICTSQHRLCPCFTSPVKAYHVGIPFSRDLSDDLLADWWIMASVYRASHGFYDARCFSTFNIFDIRLDPKTLWHFTSIRRKLVVVVCMVKLAHNCLYTHRYSVSYPLLVLFALS